MGQKDLSQDGPGGIRGLTAPGQEQMRMSAVLILYAANSHLKEILCGADIAAHKNIMLLDKIYRLPKYNK